MIFDDHRVPRRTLEKIEAEANRCRSYAELDQDGRIDHFQLLSALSIKLAVKPDAAMGDNEAYSMAGEGQIVCRRKISAGLRFGDPHARYVIAHELGHFFLHRGTAPKARKISGNKTLTFIHEEESAEIQAWKFARALFVSRAALETGETDEAIGIRVGLATGPVSLRREEVLKAIKASQPKTVPSAVKIYLEKARLAANEAKAAKSIGAREDAERHRAWALAAQIQGEDPAKVRSARGFWVEWNDYGHADSQVGWTMRNGEVRAFIDLQSR
jgi:hypothetical protein